MDFSAFSYLLTCNDVPKMCPDKTVPLHILSKTTSFSTQTTPPRLRTFKAKTAWLYFKTL